MKKYLLSVLPDLFPAVIVAPVIAAGFPIFLLQLLALLIDARLDDEVHAHHLRVHLVPTQSLLRLHELLLELAHDEDEEGFAADDLQRLNAEVVDQERHPPVADVRGLLPGSHEAVYEHPVGDDDPRPEEPRERGEKPAQVLVEDLRPLESPDVPPTPRLNFFHADGLHGEHSLEVVPGGVGSHRDALFHLLQLTANLVDDATHHTLHLTECSLHHSCSGAEGLRRLERLTAP